MSDDQKPAELNDSQVGLLSADAEEQKEQDADIREKTMKSGETEEIELNPTDNKEKEEADEKKDEGAEKKKEDETKPEEDKKTKEQLKAEEKAKKEAEKKAKEEEKKRKKEEDKKRKEEEKKKKEEEKKQKDEEKKRKKEEEKAKKAEAAQAAAAAPAEGEEGAAPAEGEEGAVTAQPKRKRLQKPDFFNVNLEEDRDHRKVNELVKIVFEDVIAEPDGTHSFDGCWCVSKAVFQFTRNWMYRVLACIIGVPCGLFWGCNFALLQLSHIWCYGPCVKYTTVKMAWFGEIWSLIVRTILDPLFDSIGRCLRAIRVERTVTTLKGDEHIA